MRNALLTITILLIIGSAKSQSQIYKLKEFYNFEIPGSLNPLTEYIEHREIILPGGKADVTIDINEKNSIVVVDNKYSNASDSFTITEKYNEIENAVRYTVEGKKGPFIYVVTKQTDGNMNVYCFWTEGIMTKGWASMVVNE